MTANELADLNEWSCCAYSKQVSAMLRQQQAEIEALHNLVKEQDKKIIDLAFDLEYAKQSVNLY